MKALRLFVTEFRMQFLSRSLGIEMTNFEYYVLENSFFQLTFFEKKTHTDLKTWGQGCLFK
ncbi:hypothetical protein B0A81_01825 [Flavobacterium plurextorum]|uniref:Uncharacterized protein n=1 Tax=Flavobacterium plurextorum TaxID=1114867 RepID=A0ABX4D0L0_9FLAO|nr:hypothetical protein B0A81_01825 [Flavobacterium plurextorum]